MVESGPNLSMKKFNNIEFINSLAKVTSHIDRDIIERSLLQTLLDYTPAEEYRLYRVMTHSIETGLALVAYAKNNVIDNPAYENKNDKLSDEVTDAVEKALDSQSIQIVQNSKGDNKSHIIYPAMDNNNEKFAVLIQSSKQLDFDNQRLIHALLKVYSNYLELIDKTRRDKLTRLLNRETLESEISNILTRNNTLKNHVVSLASYPEDDSRKTLLNSFFWLGMVDIDFFKKINDTYGHLYGDDVLILVARLLEKSIREYDLAFRYGGEEFVIILAAHDHQTAAFAFERIRLEINSHPFANLDSVTVSIGFTQVINQVNPSEVLEEADNALYYAKDNGRNQTRFYSKLLEDELIKSSKEEIKAGDIDFF
jgi:diguanylate cyclase (GGDEF)-like protein